MQIPRQLAHIWIGPYDKPSEWMDSWVKKHPEWEYTVYDNTFLNSRRFRNQKLIDAYMERGRYAGVADVIRYEMLYETGGFIAPADAICLENTDELFTRACAYTVYENEFLRGQLVSPILACEPGNTFVELLNEALLNLSTDDLDAPWAATGNKFVAEMIEEHDPDVVIFPSHYLIPIHYLGRVYKGDDKIYAKQMFGSTRNAYTRKKTLREGIGERYRTLRGSMARKKVRRNRDKLFD